MIKSLSPYNQAILVLCTCNNTDGNKLEIFSSIALYCGNNYILSVWNTYIKLISCKHLEHTGSCTTMAVPVFEGEKECHLNSNLRVHYGIASPSGLLLLETSKLWRSLPWSSWNLQAPKTRWSLQTSVSPLSFASWESISTVSSWQSISTIPPSWPLNSVYIGCVEWVATGSIKLCGLHTPLLSW